MPHFRPLLLSVLLGLLCLLPVTASAQQGPGGLPTFRTPSLQDIKAQDFNEDLMEVRRQPTDKLLAKAIAHALFFGEGDTLEITKLDGEPLEVSDKKRGDAINEVERDGRYKFYATIRGETLKCERQGDKGDLKDANRVVVMVLLGRRSDSMICAFRPLEEDAVEGET